LQDALDALGIHATVMKDDRTPAERTRQEADQQLVRAEMMLMEGRRIDAEREVDGLIADLAGRTGDDKHLKGTRAIALSVRARCLMDRQEFALAAGGYLEALVLFGEPGVLGQATALRYGDALLGYCEARLAAASGSVAPELVFECERALYQLRRLLRGGWHELYLPLGGVLSARGKAQLIAGEAGSARDSWVQALAAFDLFEERGGRAPDMEGRRAEIHERLNGLRHPADAFEVWRTRLHVEVT